MSIFEAGMLMCFGASWPVAVRKTFKAKCVQGKSVSFSYLVLLGYFCGITHKLIYSLDWVLILYIINTIFLIIDIYLYYRYRKNPPRTNI